MNEFISFLMRAKAATYASSGDGGGETLPDGRKILTYREGLLQYEDIYRGMNPFIGTETVYLLKKGAENKIELQEEDWEALWAMNYAGKSIGVGDPSHSFAKNVYQFLREALKIVPKEAPFRGPASFFSQDNKFFYVNRWSGDLSFFRGQEYIYDAVFGEVYRLDYHGLLIRPL